MPVIHLQRERAHTDRLRPYKVLMDGMQRSVIKHGDSVALEVEPGVHRIQLAVDWCRSPEIAVETNGDVQLTCVAAASPSNVIFYAIFRRNAYIDVAISRQDI